MNLNELKSHLFHSTQSNINIYNTKIPIRFLLNNHQVISDFVKQDHLLINIQSKNNTLIKYQRKKN